MLRTLAGTVPSRCEKVSLGQEAGELACSPGGSLISSTVKRATELCKVTSYALVSGGGEVEAAYNKSR